MTKVPLLHHNVKSFYFSSTFSRFSISILTKNTDKALMTKRKPNNLFTFFYSNNKHLSELLNSFSSILLNKDVLLI